MRATVQRTLKDALRRQVLELDNGHHLIREKQALAAGLPEFEPASQAHVELAALYDSSVAHRIWEMRTATMTMRCAPLVSRSLIFRRSPPRATSCRW